VGADKTGADKSGADASKALSKVVVTAAAVKAQPIERRVSLVGTLHGFEKVTLTPKVEGRVLAIEGEVGDRVKPGALLLELDPTDYELAVDEAERGLETELARLGLEEVPTDGIDVESQPSVVRATLLLDNARRRFDRQKALLSSAVSTREAYEQIETELKVAEATLRQTRLEIQSTLAAVRHRQAILAQARPRLAETKLSAPTTQMPQSAKDQDKSSSDGTAYVIARRMTSVGEMVRAFPSTPVFELVVDSVLKLKATVPERLSSQLRAGQPVEVRVEAYPQEVFAATILRLNPTVDPQSRTFEVEALVPNQDYRLRHGGFAKADVITDKQAQGTVVPLSAITSFAGINKVFVLRDGAAQEVLTRLGMRGEGWVEVIPESGTLEDGDLVATSGQSRLANGTPVEIRDPTAVGPWE
ncbi:MAG: efflux RND transporter periplasmic adaptor subunit, partial [Planctomycetota bacterium]